MALIALVSQKDIIERYSQYVVYQKLSFSVINGIIDQAKSRLLFFLLELNEKIVLTDGKEDYT